MAQGKIAIIDYGVGNVHSVSCALTFLGYKNVTTRAHEVIRSADALILPGVGAFGQAMDNLIKFDLVNVLHDEVNTKKKPIIGICLGMQILGFSSEESPGIKGLGWIDFKVEQIPNSGSLKVPHVGWNTISVMNRQELFKGLEEQPHFYFDHGYYANCAEISTVAYCDYGINIPAVVGSSQILGVQFHPEKSQQNGLKLFRNYFNHVGVLPC